MRRLQAEVHGGRSAAALPGACQAASGSDVYRGREHIGGGARSGRKRYIGERLGQKGGAIALERMRAISAWRTSGLAETIVASTIALDEMWTYLGARKGEKRNDLWVWTAVVEERDGSRWMDFEAGGRDESTFLRLLERLPDAERYETDAYGVYGALPVNKHVVGKYGAVNWNEGLHSMLRGKLNRLVRRTKGYTKSVEMLVNLLALVFCAKLKLNTTHH